MSIIREFTLYLHAGITTPEVIHANQYSQGETWIFKLLQDDGSVYVPSTGALIGVKADGHAIAGLTGTVLGDGRVSITTTQQLTAAAGDATCELTIDGGTNGSANFVIRVEKKPTDDAILSESDLSIIQQGLNSVTPAAINESVSNYLEENLTDPPIDPTLSISNAAADAKVTGDKITELKTAVADIENNIGVFKFTNIGYDIALLTEIIKTSVGNTSEVSLGTAGIAFENQHTYLMFASFIVNNGDTVLSGTYTPYFRNRSANSNITIPSAQRKTSTSSEHDQVGKIFSIWGYYTAAQDYTSICSKFVWTKDSWTTGTTIDITPLKNYIFDITGMTSDEITEFISLISESENTTEKYLYSNGYIPKLQDDINDIKESLLTYDTDLLCWGDSLTAGAGGGGTNFPAVCANELDISVLNCGVGGESANTICARQGGSGVMIPAGSVNGEYDDLYDTFGYPIYPLVQGSGNGSGNKIIIRGQECNLALSNSKYVISGYTGSPTSIPSFGFLKGAEFTGKIVTIFVGQNGWHVPDAPYNTDTLMSIIDSMISHIGHDRFVILGFSTGTESERSTADLAMLLKYGNKFFPTRKMLVSYGMTLEGLTPTSQDTEDIASGKVPSSLRNDSIHLNQYGYDALGKMLADKIRSLGYVE